MAYSGNDSDEYLPDSDDSNNQDDERPNRWTGAPSTWQQLNSAEIDTFTALNEIRNLDLSVHLYNAFALKQRHKKGTARGRDGAGPVPNEDVDIATGQPVREDKWVPPKSWTAWPLPVARVPKPEFMKRADAADAPFRMHVSYKPRSELEETISATMLKLAKEKFRARQATQQDGNVGGLGHESSDDEGSGMEVGSARGRARSTSRARSVSKPRSTKYKSASESEMMDTGDSQVEKRSSSPHLKLDSLKTVVATDDELSYSLLRPSARRMLAKLDTTLTVLHKAQESRNYCPSDSDTSDASSRSQSRSSSRSRSRSRSRGRGLPNIHPRPETEHRKRLSNPIAAEESVPAEGLADGKKRGRPRKTYPRLEGETDRAYAVRIARLRKKPIPRFPEDNSEPASDSTPAPNSAGEYTDSNTRAQGPSTTPRPRRQRRGTDALSEATSGDEMRGKPRRPPRMSRIRLRDWRDVLGAAALAGFPAAALDRAARRCADLFGQDFVLHTLHEGGPDQAGPDKYVHYEPGMPVPDILVDVDAGGDIDDEAPPKLRLARATSLTASEGETPRRSRSLSLSRSRSRSASAGGVRFCVFPSCPRVVEPFARRQNLVRHLKLVHKCGDDVLEVDSEDEMHGAVHVDGFLKPIKMRPGWRADDVAAAAAAEKKKKNKGRPRKSARDESREGEDTRMWDAGSTTSYEASD